MAHVTFIHGISNKPARETLHDIWLRALASGTDGVGLGAEGVTSTMIYWADVLYAEPESDASAFEGRGESSLQEVDADAKVRAPVATSSDEAAFMSGLAFKLGGTLAAAEAVDAMPADRTAEGRQFERVPVPWFLKEAFLKTFLRDVHHYLFNTEISPRPGETYRVQDEIRRRFVAAIEEGAKAPGPHIVVSHSMGTVIAYDCLKRVPETKSVQGLVTIGSPLGIDEIQDRLQPGWSREDGFPSERVSGRWINIFDRLDPVDGFDPFLANDFQYRGQASVLDVEVSNEGAWRHSMVKYLRAERLRKELSALLGL